MWQKPDTPKVGVGVVLKDGSGRVLLGRRKGSHGKGEWSLPGGHVELGESMLVACSREVKEETGIDIYGISPVGFSNDIFEDEGLHYVTLFFEGLFKGNQKAKDREPDKTEKWMWFGKDDIPSPLFPPLKKVIGDIFA
jgi:8-oxo-dGTP diphosphatase